MLSYHLISVKTFSFLIFFSCKPDFLSTFGLNRGVGIFDSLLKPKSAWIHSFTFFFFSNRPLYNFKSPPLYKLHNFDINLSPVFIKTQCYHFPSHHSKYSFLKKKSQEKFLFFSLCSSVVKKTLEKFQEDKKNGHRSHPIMQCRGNGKK